MLGAKYMKEVLLIGGPKHGKTHKVAEFHNAITFPRVITRKDITDSTIAGDLVYDTYVFKQYRTGTKVYTLYMYDQITEIEAEELLKRDFIDIMEGF